MNAKETGTVDSRRNIPGEFAQQFTNLKRNFTARKETNEDEWILPLAYKDFTTPPPHPIEETRTEVSAVESKPDTRIVTCEFLPILTICITLLLPSVSGRGQSIGLAKPILYPDRFPEPLLLGSDPTKRVVENHFLVR